MTTLLSDQNSHLNYGRGLQKAGISETFHTQGPSSSGLKLGPYFTFPLQKCLFQMSKQTDEHLPVVINQPHLSSLIVVGPWDGREAGSKNQTAGISTLACFVPLPTLLGQVSCGTRLLRWCKLPHQLLKPPVFCFYILVEQTECVTLRKICKEYGHSFVRCKRIKTMHCCSSKL